MLAKVRASPDFKGLSEADALADLRERIGHYERQYETVEDAEGAYIKLFNLSSKVAANQVFGRMSTRVLPCGCSRLEQGRRARPRARTPRGSHHLPRSAGTSPRCTSARARSTSPRSCRATARRRSPARRRLN